MFTFVLIVHSFVSVALIIAILLHRGKGYGLSMMMGGGMPTTFAGSSIVEKNLNRITVGLALIFSATSVALYFLV